MTNNRVRREKNRHHELNKATNQQDDSYLSDTGVAHPDYVQECGHDLGQELDTLEAQRLKDKGHSMDYHRVVVGQGGVSQDAH